MKKLAFLIFSFSACTGSSQVNLPELTPLQWQQDLDYLVNKIDKQFAGFTTESRIQFKTEASKIREAIPQLSVNQRILEFARLLALLNDGHTEISLVGPRSNFTRFPLLLYYFGNELRVVGASQRYKDLLGNRVVKIDNQNVTDVLEKLKPYMNRDNDIEYITTAPTLMIIPEVLHSIGVLSNPSKATFSFMDDQGNEAVVELQSETLKEYNKENFVRVFEKAPLYLNNLEKGYWFKYIPETKVMYINLITLYNQDEGSSIKRVVAEMLEQFDMQNAERLVIDFRLCRGGNYNHILPLIEEIKKRPELNSKGKLFVINGRLTFSAAAVATVHFKDETQATIVGEVSRAKPNWAENMEGYSLPNSKLEFDCTNQLKVHSPALGKSDRIPVDVEINRSFDLYKAGRDEVMEYILSLKD